MTTDQLNQTSTLTDARMVEIARENGLIITTQAEADMVTLLGRAFEKALGVVTRTPDLKAAAALDDAYPTLEQRITTLVNAYHSHMVAKDEAAAHRVLGEVVALARGAQQGG